VNRSRPQDPVASPAPGRPAAESGFFTFGQELNRQNFSVPARKWAASVHVGPEGEKDGFPAFTSGFRVGRMTIPARDHLDMGHERPDPAICLCLHWVHSSFEIWVAGEEYGPLSSFFGGPAVWGGDDFRPRPMPLRPGRRDRFALIETRVTQFRRCESFRGITKNNLSIRTLSAGRATGFRLKCSKR